MGVTLIELGLSVAVASLVVAFALVQYTRMSEASRSRDLISLVTVILKEVPKSAPNRAYAGLTTQILIGMGGIPDQHLGVGETTIVNPWQRPLDVTAHTYGEATQPNAVLIETSGVPAAACNELIRSLGRHMQVVEVAGQVLIQRAGPSPRLFGSLTVADISSACEDSEAATLRLVPNV